MSADPTPPVPYLPGQLRIVRDARSTLNPAAAHNVEETTFPHHQINSAPVGEKDALQLMRDLGSPYPGERFPDNPFAPHPGMKMAVPVATESEHIMTNITTHSTDRNSDQPPGVDIDDDRKQLPPVKEASARVFDFVSWFGDGEIWTREADEPPLYSRDLAALQQAVDKQPSDAEIQTKALLDAAADLPAGLSHKGFYDWLRNRAHSLNPHT